MGLSLAAWRVNQRPKPTPTTTENAMATNIENIEILIVQAATIDRSAAMPQPKPIPTTPPINVITIDSMGIVSILR